MSFYPYIVAWDEVHDNVVEIESQFLNAGQKCTVINSGQRLKENWDNVGDIRYYRQLRRAIESFDPSYDYMGFICGDVSYDRWKDVLERTDIILNNYNVGVYAPHLTHEPWSKDSCYLKTVNSDGDLFLSCQTDGIMVFINKDIVRLLKEYFDFFDTQANLSNYTSGWGMDAVWSILSMYHNLPILRDNKYIVNHPAGSSYDHGKATQEMGDILRIFFEYAKTKSYALVGLQKLKENIDGRMARIPEYMNPDVFYKQDLKVEKAANEFNYHLISIDDSRITNKTSLYDRIGTQPVSINSLNARNEEELKSFFKKNPEFNIDNWNPKIGEIGCFGSHYLAWKYLIDSNLNTLTVFEDDIIIYDNFFERYNELINNAPKDWDIISIFVDPNQYDRFDESQKINYYVSKGYQDWSTLGYVISKSGAKKICDYIKKNGISQPVDWFLFRNGHAGTFNVCTLPPYLRSPLAIDHKYQSQVQGE